MSDSKTPTEKLTHSAIDGKTVKDKSGKTFVLRKPDLLDQYDFAKAMGEDANNPILLGIMIPITYIAKIDGLVFETPRSHSECRAALKRVGEEGVLAIREAIENVISADDVEAKDSIKK